MKNLREAVRHIILNTPHARQAAVAEAVDKLFEDVSDAAEIDKKSVWRDSLPDGRATYFVTCDCGQAIRVLTGAPRESDDCDVSDCSNDPRYRPARAQFAKDNPRCQERLGVSSGLGDELSAARLLLRAHGLKGQPIDAELWNDIADWLVAHETRESNDRDEPRRGEQWCRKDGRGVVEMEWVSPAKDFVRFLCISGDVQDGSAPLSAFLAHYERLNRCGSGQHDGGEDDGR